MKEVGITSLPLFNRGKIATEINLTKGQEHNIIEDGVG